MTQANDNPANGYYRDDLITDAQIDKAWQYANFGDRKKRDVILETLCHVAEGYLPGRTALCIVMELNLIRPLGDDLKYYKVTELGVKYLLARNTPATPPKASVEGEEDDVYGIKLRDKLAADAGSPYHDTKLARIMAFKNGWDSCEKNRKKFWYDAGLTCEKIINNNQSPSFTSKDMVDFADHCARLYFRLDDFTWIRKEDREKSYAEVKIFETSELLNKFLSNC